MTITLSMVIPRYYRMSPLMLRNKYWGNVTFAAQGVVLPSKRKNWEWKSFGKFSFLQSFRWSNSVASAAVRSGECSAFVRYLAPRRAPGACMGLGFAGIACKSAKVWLGNPAYPRRRKIPSKIYSGLVCNVGNCSNCRPGNRRRRSAASDRKAVPSRRPSAAIHANKMSGLVADFANAGGKTVMPNVYADSACLAKA